jgi:hypothetical protein
LKTEKYFYNMKGFDINKIEMGADSKVPVEKLLSGEVIKGLSDKSQVQPTAELEGDEHLQFPDGTTQKVVGPSHEGGGVKMDIPDGTKILSKSIKLDKKDIKAFNKKYDLKLTTEDTYASALDKYIKKIGLSKLYKEQEDLFSVLKKSKENTTSEGTSRVNEEYLSKKINNVEQRKQPLENEKSMFFDTLFDKQEYYKKPEDQAESFKYGGVTKSTFEKMCAKYGISPEEGMAVMGIQKFKYAGVVGGSDRFQTKVAEDLYNEFQTNTSLKPEDFKKKLSEANSDGTLAGGDYYMLFNLLKDKFPDQIAPTATAGTFTVSFNENKFKNLELDYQPVKGESYGNFEKSRKDIVVQLYRNFPDRVSEELKDYVNIDKLKKGEVEFKKDLSFNTKNNLVLGLQEKMNSRMVASADAIINAPEGTFSPETIAQAKDYKERQTFIKKESLTKDSTPEQRVRTYDAAMGDFSAGRYTPNIAVVQPEELKSLQGKGIYTLKQISDEDLKTLSPETQAKVTKAKSLLVGDADFSLNQYTPNVKAPEADKAPVKAPEEGPIEDLVAKNYVKNPKYPRMFFHAAQTVLPPTPLQATYMGNIQTQYIDPTRIGIENNIQALNSQQQFVAKQLDSLPPSQRAAAMSNLLASTQTQVNDATTKANQINAQAENQAELFNIGQFDRNQQNKFNLENNYVNKMEQAQANLEDNLRRYFTFNQNVAIHNKASDDKLNLLSSIFDFQPNFYANQIEFAPNSNYSMEQVQSILDSYNKAKE